MCLTVQTSSSNQNQLFFIHGALHPFFSSTGTVAVGIPPCKSLCTEVNVQCATLFQQYSSFVSPLQCDAIDPVRKKRMGTNHQVIMSPENLRWKNRLRIGKQVHPQISPIASSITLLPRLRVMIWSTTYLLRIWFTIQILQISPQMVSYPFFFFGWFRVFYSKFLEKLKM